MDNTELKSYKPYARLVTVLSAIIICIASLDATQVINLFPEYASQINTVLVLCGVLAPALAQELRVVRAEDLIKEEYDAETETGTEEVVNVVIDNLNVEEEIIGEDDIA